MRLRRTRAAGVDTRRKRIAAGVGNLSPVVSARCVFSHMRGHGPARTSPMPARLLPLPLPLILCQLLLEHLLLLPLPLLHRLIDN